MERVLSARSETYHCKTRAWDDAHTVLIPLGSSELSVPLYMYVVGVCDAGRQGAVELEPPEPVDAVMCVEIIRASGLLAAVNEASIWLGGGTCPLHLAMPAVC